MGVAGCSQYLGGRAEGRPCGSPPPPHKRDWKLPNVIITTTTTTSAMRITVSTAGRAPRITRSQLRTRLPSRPRPIHRRRPSRFSPTYERSAQCEEFLPDCYSCRQPKPWDSVVPVGRTWIVHHGPFRLDVFRLGLWREASGCPVARRLAQAYAGGIQRLVEGSLQYRASREGALCQYLHWGSADYSELKASLPAERGRRRSKGDNDRRLFRWQNEEKGIATL
jgi:hypothetical protein